MPSSEANGSYSIFQTNNEPGCLDSSSSKRSGGGKDPCTKGKRDNAFSPIPNMSLCGFSDIKPATISFTGISLNHHSERRPGLLKPELPHRRLSQPPELDDPITSGWAPLGFCRKRVGGFRNRGTLCYRNAVLVVLMNTPVFLKWLIRYHKSHETCTSEQQKCLTCCFYRLYHLYWVKEDDGKDRLQRCLKPLWGRLAKTSWNGYTQGQQDARAFLECIFQQLLVEVDEQGCRELNDIFKIRVSRNKKCCKCERLRNWPDEKFFMVYAPEDENTPGFANIEERLLDKSEYSIEKCGKCGQETGHLTSEKALYLPEVLLVQFPRMKYDKRTNEPRRIRAPVFLQSEIELPPGLLSDTVKIEGCARYELFGIVFHTPDETDIQLGHYTCAVMGPDNKWAHQDDMITDTYESLDDILEGFIDNQGGMKPGHNDRVYWAVYHRVPLERPLDLGSGVWGEDQAWVMQPTDDDEPPTNAKSHGSPNAGSPRGSSPEPGLGSMSIAPHNAVCLEQTIHLKGRRLNWKVNDQLVISEGDGPLIWLKPGKKVQHAEVRLRLVCQKTRELLTGRGIIPLKPEILLEPYDAGPRPDTFVRDVGTQTRLSFRGEDNRQVRPSGSAQDRVISGKIIKASSPKRSQLATRASI
ncbi:cysteine proteinase [Aspergillus niger ATCC 13496]|uniref:Contig An07c0380, genomic contig n=3 Tax=Aspergillus niger TaxID=5061 RepID=A2QPP2_ASPNC|nr:uncharacterized protein An07g10130 [Aspergillus niger]RDH15281.1 cysteine proteinase [Aspergillus niger ATCC 13496]CAK45142.1 unnamed protein product [Aspergillus niger]